MTKRRAALTYENALCKVAGLIGWARCAEILKVAERTVRNWSDPDTAANVRMDAGEQLDLEYQQAGGAGAPFFEVYGTRLKTALAATFGSAEAIATAAASAAKEGGEGVAWAIRASRPDADDGDYERAERELEESIEASTRALAAIRNRRAAERALHEEETAG